jgi:hypothetical protein
MQYCSLCVWLVSLYIMSSWHIHVAANERISFLWLNNIMLYIHCICVYIYIYIYIYIYAHIYCMCIYNSATGYVSKRKEVNLLKSYLHLLLSFIVVLDGGTWWHLQKFLQYIKYRYQHDILIYHVEFTTSSILLYPHQPPLMD